MRLNLILSLWLLIPAAGHAQAAKNAVPVAAVRAAPAAAADIQWLPNFNYTPPSMSERFDGAKKRLLGKLDEIAAIPAPKRTFDNTVKALETAYAEFNESMTPPIFLSQVSGAAEIRDAANELEKQTNQLMIELGFREDVYKAVKEYAQKKETLSGEDKKLLVDQLLVFKRNGLDLPEKDRERLKELQKRISDLQVDYQNNVKNDKTSVTFFKDQLDGLSADFIRELKPLGDGQVEMTLDYPHYEVFMQNAKNPALRQAVEFKFNNKAADKNLAILDEVLKKRDEAAKLLGYRSHAAYALDYRRMAKEPKNVWDFLNRLKALLEAPVAAEKKELLALKQKEQPMADQIYNWDVTGLIGQQISYLLDKLIKQKYAFDPEEVREYFPVNRVVDQTLLIYQELFGLKFKELAATSPASGVTGKTNCWHPEVRMFEILDAAGKEHDLSRGADRISPTGAASGEAIGYFYLDLYPREGKYNHMAAFDIQVGRRLADGTYRKPVAAMVGNFTRATATKPALMSHDEVETFFHEFGHIMHQTLTKARYSSFSGSNVARDFVEAPSQMLENFVWKPVVLNRLSGYYKDETKKLPKALLAKMLAAKNADSALGTLRILALAELDMTFHSGAPADTTAIVKQVFEQAGYLSPTPGTHFQARWGHIMDGYDAGYYGYLWSRVYAQDIFTRFEKAGVLSPQVGMDYRRKILERGSSVDESQELHEFLGREPNEKAFIRSLGLPPAGGK